jgi:hypothetical protein
MIRLLKLITLFIVITVLSSCDAPRLNPLDPLGQNYTRGQIDGYVYSYPRTALSGVRVTWKNENISVVTDSKGYYIIKNVSTSSDGYVYIEKDGFTKDTISVQWNNQKSIRLNETILDCTSGTLTGIVKAASPSSKALANVKVTWKNQNIFTYTNSSGSFSLTNIPFEDGWIIFEIDGYNKDSTEVSFSSQRESLKTLETKYLNSVPTLNSFVINTSVENNSTSKNYYMIVSASITDVEKDVDHVLFTCSELDFSKTLSYNPDTKCYEGTYQQSGLEAIQNNVGKAFLLTAIDGNSRQFSLGSTMITRLIKDQISLSKPANEDIVTSLPITLEWQNFSPGFSFHYFAKVYYNNHNSDPVWSQDNISSNDFKITIGTKENPILTDGYYIWELWCVDTFGNKSRSMLADFYIQTE